MEPVNGVKLAKFKMLLAETCKWFYHEDNIDDSFALLPFCLPVIGENIIEKYLSNPYLKAIYDTCFAGDVDKTGPEISELLGAIQELKTEIVCCDVLAQQSYYLRGAFFSYKIRGGLIFWSLVLAAIDEEFYENEVNMIADLAYMLEFNEDMMADWIKAVKYLLDGNMFNENMDIGFKTDEAKLFFLHEEKNNKSHI